MSRLRGQIEELSRSFTGMVTRSMWRLLIDILVDLDRRATLAVGPGLQIRDGSAGQELRVRASESTEAMPTPREKVGTPTQLGAVFGTRDTDTWTKDDGKQALMQVLTDLWYDDQSHKLLARLRTLAISESGRVMAISAESDPATLIIELAECEAQPET